MGFKLVLILTMSNDKALAPRAKIYLGNGREVEKSTLQKYPRCVKNLCILKKKKKRREISREPVIRSRSRIFLNSDSLSNLGN